MEEHLQAYFAWRAEGIQNAWCWHVDAHLDIGKTGLGPDRLSALSACADFEAAESADLLGNSYLPWGGLHCGNYLYPAISEGIVGRLTWVIPPDLPEGPLLTWAQGHINDWFDLSLSEFASLKLDGNRVVGTLLGIPFEMGTLESLDLPQEPVLLDIDIDYFLKEDGSVWQDSRRFAEAIAPIPRLFTTVAYSVKGGFTPDWERRLAEPFFPQDRDSSASIGIDEPPYTATSLDELAALVRCHRYREALQCSAGDSQIEVLFLRGTALQALERIEEALDLWQALLENPAVQGDARAYLHGLCSEILCQLKRPSEALEHSLKGQKLDPLDYRHHWAEAVSLEALGQIRKATKVLRRVVKLSEHHLFGLKARYALVRLYQAQKKDGLAKMELRQLAQLDVTGQFRPVTLLHGV